MASVHRSRSLRKPSAATSTASTTSTSTSTSRSASTSLRPVEKGPVDASKRNASPSRLPLKPPLRSGLATSASSASAPSTGPRASARPLSGIARTPSLRQPSSASQGPSRQVSSASQGPSRQPLPSQDPSRRDPARHYPPSTAATRGPAPTTRPTSSGGGASTSTPARRVPTHTRAKSSVTSSAASAALRPPSRGQPSTTTTSTTTRALHTRPASAGKLSPALPPSSTATTTAAPTTTKLSQTQHPRMRPAFNALQQHYSPAKSSAAKPLTAAILAPPSPSKLPANVAASAETSRLQTELLQLHLLHRDAAATRAQWSASARNRLGARFADLADASAELTARERESAERGNAAAVRAWAATSKAGGGRTRGRGGVGLDEKVQALDAVMSGVWALSEPGGRYARVVRRFERWMDRVAEIEDAREGGAASLRTEGGDDTFLIGELDTSWKDECDGLTRRLEGWRQQLVDIIADVPDMDGKDDAGGQPPNLARMVAGARSLVFSMLDEVHVMAEMEEEALAREEVWIETMVSEDEERSGAGAIWRSM